MAISPPSPHATRRRRILARRGLTVAALAALLFGAPGGPSRGAVVLVAAFALSEVALAFVPRPWFGRSRFDLALGAIDLGFVGAGILIAPVAAATTPARPLSLAVSLLITVMLVSLASDRWHAVSGIGAACALHAWIVASGPAPHAAMSTLILECAVLIAAGAHYGALATPVHARRRREAIDEAAVEEMETLQAILDGIADAPDLETLAETIVRRIGAVVPAVRCSLLCLDPAGRRGWVIASHDAPELPLIEIQLEDYPEVRRAIETRDPVLIQDAFSDPLTEAVRDRLVALDFRSMMVIPVESRGHLHGLLFLRASGDHARFGRRDVNLCTAVARAAAIPLGNVLAMRARAAAQEPGGRTIRAAG